MFIPYFLDLRWDIAYFAPFYISFPNYSTMYQIRERSYMNLPATIFEGIMILCWGVSWPAAVKKTLFNFTMVATELVLYYRYRVKKGEVS